MEEFVVNDWTGGIVDDYLNGPVKCARRLDNLLINRNGKLIERPGSQINSPTYYVTPSAARIANLFLYPNNSSVNLTAHVGDHIYGMSTTISDYVEMVGPTSNPCFGTGTMSAATALSSRAEWQDIMFLCASSAFASPRFIYNPGGGYIAGTVGLPDLASSPAGALTAGGTPLSYAYAFCYAWTFSAAGVSYTWRGPTTLLSVSGNGTAVAGGAPISITGIPVLANSTTENWDTTNIIVEIYRTGTGLTDLRLVGHVTNGTTIYSDTTTDAALTGIRVYTAGGVYDKDPPPSAKFVENVGGIFWWGNCSYNTHRIRQSLQDEPNAAPSEVYTDLDGAVTGLSAVDVYLIAFEKSKTWRIEGSVDSLGNGVIRKRIISRTVGCIGASSIVKTNEGVYFAGEDGFYFTNGQKVQKLSEHLNASFQAITATATLRSRIFGCEDTLTRRVYWTAMSSDGATDCDMLYVLDPYWGLTERSTFTTWSGGEEGNFYGTAIAILSGFVYRSDHLGHIFKHSDDYYDDDVPLVGVAASSWDTQAVQYDYISCAWAFGDEVNKKYAPYINVTGKNLTNLSMLIQSANDDGTTYVDLKEVRHRQGYVWGDADAVWGDPAVIWNYSGSIIAERHFPAGQLRFLYKSIRITNARTTVAVSDNDGSATFDNGALTATYDTLTSVWPDEPVGYYLYTSNDAYTLGFRVTARTSDTVLTCVDPEGVFPNGSFDWELRGFKKGERLQLESYTVRYIGQGESTPGYQAGEDGANA